MKRLVSGLLALVVLLQVGTVQSTAYASEKDYEIYNGKVVNARLYAPIRAVGEKLKAKVNWDNATKTATVITKKTVMKMTLGSKVLKVNNEQIQMDVSLLLENGSVFLPIRFIGDALGHSTYWDKKARMASSYSEQNRFVVYAQPLFYRDGYKLLDEAINKVKNLSNVAQKRQYLKPYFTDEMINLIIMRNVTYTDLSQYTTSYNYYYPKETNMYIYRSERVPNQSNYVSQQILITKRNNQWVIGSLSENIYEPMP
ncbi:copper amine oxidase N-terminal domain-containing protein [Lysinibacillus sp. UBA5990]|uniref:copper amine oxidase N-terminal domain-containing protein n=1 Tax=Lysinibacillus sp. UBA5990 TaxID=1946773 RepID=UPI0025C211CF|nr:copper amine oxidase N-terminal domain-containing protein [Lysinibacillus sp. UBA5990]